MSDVNKPIDIDDYPIEVQVKMLRQLLDDATGDMQTLREIFDKLYADHCPVDEELLLEGLAITGEYVNADAAPTDNGER